MAIVEVTMHFNEDSQYACLTCGAQWAADGEHGSIDPQTMVRLPFASGGVREGFLCTVCWEETADFMSTQYSLPRFR